MRRFLSERNVVIILFAMVLVTFSFAQEDTKKIEKMFLNTTAHPTTQQENPEIKALTTQDKNAIRAMQLR